MTFYFQNARHISHPIMAIHGVRVIATSTVSRASLLFTNHLFLEGSATRPAGTKNQSLTAAVYEGIFEGPRAA